VSPAAGLFGLVIAGIAVIAIIAEIDVAVMPTSAMPAIWHLESSKKRLLCIQSS
jgi:hypothetical protein